MTKKQQIAKLPAVLKTALSKFPLKRPDGSIPSFIEDRVYGADSSEEEFSLELNENELIEVAEWAFKLSEKELPDDTSIQNITKFSALVIDKIYNVKYDSGELKPCDLYQKNEAVVPVGIKHRKKLNKKCEKVETEQEKGAVYAEHYGLSEAFEALNQFDQKLFFWYCYENDPKNTKVGKN